MVERFFRVSRWSLSLTLAAVMTVLPMSPAMASYGHRRHHYRRYRHHSVGAVPMYHAALLEDADSGEVLYSKDPSLEWPPASMAKMMLLLVAEDQLKSGRVSLDDPVRISERSALTAGSHLGLREGQVYPLRDLMKAALIRSANDAAVAVAEKIGGSVEATVRMMNAKAHALGMDDTYYGTIDGLPPVPGHDVDHTTALDLAILARAIIHSTTLLQWSSMEEAPFDDGRVILRNTNHLIGHFDGCDGLKTGFTMKAGFNLTATAKRGNMRLISVILGAPSNPERFIQSARLLSWGFDNFSRVEVLRRGEPLPVHVQLQSGGSIQPVAENDIAVVLPKARASGVTLKYNIPQSVSWPVSSGESLGEITVLDGNDVMTTVDAICPLGAGDAPPNQLQAAAPTAPVTNTESKGMLPISGRQSVTDALGPMSVNSAQENR
ncbi:MAG TPA: D-alanyl-D-alanine carboxypeptidase family protein [Candidatus Binataceae bacterium]|nr:D-alanyl-D-alanine carboxypeptidase family protein [Candidatus Binataceae bacterium]